MNILMIPMYSKNICFFSCFLVLQPQEKKDEDNQPQEERSDISVLFSHLPGSGSVVSLWGDASNFNGIKPIYQSLPLLELSGYSSPAGPEALHSGCTRALQWFNHERAPGQQQTLYGQRECAKHGTVSSLLFHYPSELWNSSLYLGLIRSCGMNVVLSHFCAERVAHADHHC